MPLEANVEDARHAKDWLANIVKVLGPGIVGSSAAADGLADILAAEGKRYRCILEIGTYRAVSSAVLACFTETLITIDVKRQPEVSKVLSVIASDLRDRICAIVVPDNDAKVLLARHLDFDMAFIDGAHTEGQVFLDFALVRNCGQVLFHDYPGQGRHALGPGIVLGRTLDGVVTPKSPFAWWKAKQDCPERGGKSA